MLRELGAGARGAVDAARRLCPVVAGQLVEQHSPDNHAALGRDAPPARRAWLAQWEPVLTGTARGRGAPAPAVLGSPLTRPAWRDGLLLHAAAPSGAAKDIVRVGSCARSVASATLIATTPCEKSGGRS